MLLGGNHFDETTDDLVGADPFGLGIEIGENAVPQDRRRHLAHILASGEKPPVQYGPRLGPQHQVLAGPRPGPPAHEFLNEVGHFALLLARQPGELQRVAHHVIGDGDAPHDVL